MPEAPVTWIEKVCNWRSVVSDAESLRRCPDACSGPGAGSGKTSLCLSATGPDLFGPTSGGVAEGPALKQRGACTESES